MAISSMEPSPNAARLPEDLLWAPGLPLKGSFKGDIGHIRDIQGILGVVWAGCSHKHLYWATSMGP